MGLSYRSARLQRLACRYNNPTPESTIWYISPSQGLWIGLLSLPEYKHSVSAGCVSQSTSRVNRWEKMYHCVRYIGRKPKGTVLAGLRWNSWKFNFVEVSGHKLEISQTWGCYFRFLHFYKMLFRKKLEFSSLIGSFVWISETIGMVWFSVRFSPFDAFLIFVCAGKRCIYI